MPSDWLQIAITLKSKCIVCNKDVLPGQAFWSKSTKSFRHLTCSATVTIPESIQNTPKEDEIKQENSPGIVEIRNAPIEELLCFICGAKTGCNECSLLQDCTERLESKYCICESCAYGQSDMSRTYREYQQAFLKLMDSQNK